MYSLYVCVYIIYIYTSMYERYDDMVCIIFMICMVCMIFIVYIVCTVCMYVYVCMPCIVYMVCMLCRVCRVCMVFMICTVHMIMYHYGMFYDVVLVIRFNLLHLVLFIPLKFGYTNEAYGCLNICRYTVT